MRCSLSSGLLALAFGVALTTMTVPGTAAADVGITSTPPELGISFYAEGHSGQCGGTGEQWRPAPDWTNPIRFDTDSRTGGCQLAFGIRDLAGSLSGLWLSYRWQVSPGGDWRQCGNPGEYQVPITPYLAFGPHIKVDTDDKVGWCDLTFTMYGRTDVSLDIQFWSDGASGQCQNSLPPGLWHTVRQDVPITIGIDADNRTGGCQFALRLRQH